jgi:hypothetical protein
MKILLSELRMLIGVSLLLEAIDIVAIAHELVDTKDKCLVVHAGKPASVLVLDTKIPESGAPTVTAAARVKRFNDTNILVTLYSTNADDAILVMYATLKEFGSVVPDDRLSPAASEVLKRYFVTYKDDEEYIVRNKNYPDSFLKATYLSPPGGPSIEALKIRGKDLLDETETSLNSILNDAAVGFGKAYQDPIKSGRLRDPKFTKLVESNGRLENAIKLKDPNKILSELYVFLEEFSALLDSEEYIELAYRLEPSLVDIHDELARKDAWSTWKIGSLLNKSFGLRGFKDKSRLNKMYFVMFFYALEDIEVAVAPTSHLITRLLDVIEKMFVENKTRALNVIDTSTADELADIRSKINDETMQIVWDQTFEELGIII